MEVVLYTDASYCHKAKIAACGFVVLVQGKIIKHEVLLLGDCLGSKVGEIFIATHALQYAFMMKGVTKIILYTDFIAIIGFGKKAIRSSEHYKELHETLEMIKENGITSVLRYVKAHAENKMNNLVDISARTQLRKYLKTKA